MQQMNQQMTGRQEQRQGMIPTEIMQQSLHMLQMNTFELDQFIEENLETNPFLERVGTRETSLSDVSEQPLETVRARNSPGKSSMRNGTPRNDTGKGRIWRGTGTSMRSGAITRIQ